MFSGIIAAVGKIVSISPLEKGLRLDIDATLLGTEDIAIGDSVACNGVCLTVVAKAAGVLTFDVSRESLDCTVGLAAPGPVNLEKALRLSDRLGGHLVSGHVDGVGEVTRFEQIGESWLLEIRAPQALARYIAKKGSITVDGVSLTVNAVTGSTFAVNLIPHTVAVTNLQRLQPGSKVNLEVDLIARYCERMLAADKEAQS
jgi:riboflavin synthase